MEQATNRAAPKAIDSLYLFWGLVALALWITDIAMADNLKQAAGAELLFFPSMWLLLQAFPCSEAPRATDSKYGSCQGD
jgi:hypothetical protein